jgi:hypothetical protein
MTEILWFLGAVATLFLGAVLWFAYEYRKAFNRRSPSDGPDDDDAEA